MNEIFEMFKAPGSIVNALFAPLPSSSLVKLNYGRKDYEAVVKSPLFSACYELAAP